VAEPLTDAVTDGRAARRDRNRLAVLDAVIELFAEGNLDPGPEQVAARCGLSPRSVYRYFEDRDGLQRAAIDRHLELVWPLFVIHGIGEGELDERINTFVSARLRLYQAIASAARAARLRASTNEIIRNQVEITRRALREQVEKQFAPELRPLGRRRRRSIGGAVDALCQFEALDHYRVHRSLSLGDTRALLVDSLHALLDPRDSVDSDDGRST
jgi:AcrR family transcriptional regulator